MPKGCAYLANEASKYATALAMDVQALMGEVTRDQLEIVETASSWHLHALFTLRVLRLNYDTLSPETRCR
jgi:hypothetical protein